VAASLCDPRIRGAPVPIDQTRATLIAFIATVARRGRLERHLAADVTFAAVATGQFIYGRAAVARFIRTFHGGAFNARTRVKASLVNGQRVVLELDLVGTHTGEFLGVAATGRPIDVPCTLAFEVRDGMIGAMAGYLPIGSLLEQIGGTALATTAIGDEEPD
jgi:hypothetical protein